MRKIINGKRYDTETAEELGSNSYGCRSDFDQFCESVYRTKRGAFFLAGFGGPRSKYSLSVRMNEWSGGEDLHPLTPQEAVDLLEQWGETEALERYFQDAIEDA